MAFAIKGEVKGVAPLLLAMSNVKRSVTNRIARASILKGARIIRAAARKFLRPGHGYESGLLRKSIDVVIRTYKTGVTLAIIGPRTGMKQRVVVGGGRGALLSAKGSSRVMRRRGHHVRTEDPTRIAHLVEYGTQPHAVGKGSQRVRRVLFIFSRAGVQRGWVHPGTDPRPFMRPALASTKAQVAAAVQAGMMADLARLAAKGSAA
jgi:HK97 gp10 family phage protein